MSANPEPFKLKNMFSRALLDEFVAAVHAVWPAFDARHFLNTVFDDAWEARELKQRMRHIAGAIRSTFPPEYKDALGLVLKVARHLIEQKGEKMLFEYSFLPDFIEVYGVDDPDLSIPALETITRLSSCEFAVRPFLLRYPERMYTQMLDWTTHASPMVRRLSSEGIRPRLPWGMGVPALKRDPSPVLPILENLKNDPAETVRRSVANNLNDIAKDHPDLVLGIAQRWLGATPETDWIVRHASRGLLKKGNAQALAHFGFEKGIAGIAVSDLSADASVRIGGRLDFSFAVKNGGDAPADIRLEYGIDYLTSTGKISSKVFKIKEIRLPAGASEAVSKYQRFQDFTTRKHYPGAHLLKILVNGVALGECAFEVG
jgi:3-methyladenine DNA glycosylase AlkC